MAFGRQSAPNLTLAEREGAPSCSLGSLDPLRRVRAQKSGSLTSVCFPPQPSTGHCSLETLRIVIFAASGAPDGSVAREKQSKRPKSGARKTPGAAASIIIPVAVCLCRSSAHGLLLYLALHRLAFRRRPEDHRSLGRGALRGRRLLTWAPLRLRLRLRPQLQLQLRPTSSSRRRPTIWRRPHSGHTAGAQLAGRPQLRPLATTSSTCLGGACGIWRPAAGIWPSQIHHPLRAAILNRKEENNSIALFSPPPALINVRSTIGALQGRARNRFAARTGE